MKRISFLAFIFFQINVSGGKKIKYLNIENIPIANAGDDQTIYLTQTSNAILNGSASIGDFYHWTEISTDYQSEATISSPNSAITKVISLKQGTWYFQIVVSSRGIIAKDTVIIRVDYDLPPANSILLKELQIAGIAHVANLRDDTTKYWGYDSVHSQYYDGINYIFLERSRLNAMHVDRESGKFNSILEDGYAWNNTNYSRSELTYGYGLGLDSNKTYVIEWKGYFLQNSDNITSGKDVTVIWQLHARDGHSPPFQFTAKDNAIWWIECVAPSNRRTVTRKIADYSEFYHQTHTIRIIIKEGLAGNGAYIKVLIDGVQKYIRDTGDIGRTWQQDYLKFATLYDWGNAVVDPNNHTRNKKFSLVTEKFALYQLSPGKKGIYNTVLGLGK